MPVWPQLLSTSGSAGIVVGAFLPWIVSGRATRNSFSTVYVARQLDLVEHAAGNVVLAGWYLVPLAAAVVLLLTVLGRRRWVAAIAGPLGLVAMLFAAFVGRSPIPTDIGVTVTFVSGLVTLIGAGATMLVRPRVLARPGAGPTADAG